jgi:hypothetical protein
MFAARNAAVTASKKQYAYSFANNIKPNGMVEDATRSEMIPVNAASGRLLEKAATGGGTSHWYVQYPGLMGTRRYRATTTVGPSSPNTNRGCLVWVGGQDGSGGDGITNCVWLRVRGTTGLAVVIGTKNGLLTGTVVNQVSGANGSCASGDLISLEISESGGVYTYTGYKNGVALSGATWTDSTNVIGVPGRAWGGGGMGIFSGGWFGSLGVSAIECHDL